jgi:SAM-dependent methyltransferase
MLSLGVGPIAPEDEWRSRVRRAWHFVAEQGIGEAWRLLCRHGISGLGRFAARNLRCVVSDLLDKHFDRKYGVETRGQIRSEMLAVVGTHGRGAADFLSTPVRTILRTLECLPKDVSDFTFVDFGCGKGRALLLAQTRNFRRVIGVEHAPALVEIAERNISSWRGKRECRDVQALCADAATFPIPAEPCVLYFFAPFDWPVLEAVIANIGASLKARPRPMLAIYVAAVDEELPDGFMGNAGFHRVRFASQRFDPGDATQLPMRYALYEAALAGEQRALPPPRPPDGKRSLTPQDTESRFQTRKKAEEELVLRPPAALMPAQS